MNVARMIAPTKRSFDLSHNIDPIGNAFEELEHLRQKRELLYKQRVQQRLIALNSAENLRSKTILKERKEHYIKIANSFHKFQCSRIFVKKWKYFSRLALCHSYSSLKANVHFCKKSVYRWIQYCKVMKRLERSYYHFLLACFNKFRTNAKLQISKSLSILKIQIISQRFYFATMCRKAIVELKWISASRKKSFVIAIRFHIYKMWMHFKKTMLIRLSCRKKLIFYKYVDENLKIKVLRTLMKMKQNLHTRKFQLCHSDHFNTKKRIKETFCRLASRILRTKEAISSVHSGRLFYEKNLLLKKYFSIFICKNKIKRKRDRAVVAKLKLYYRKFPFFRSYFNHAFNNNSSGVNMLRIINFVKLLYYFSTLRRRLTAPINIKAKLFKSLLRLNLKFGRLKSLSSRLLMFRKSVVFRKFLRRCNNYTTFRRKFKISSVKSLCLSVKQQYFNKWIHWFDNCLRIKSRKKILLTSQFAIKLVCWSWGIFVAFLDRKKRSGILLSKCGTIFIRRMCFKFFRVLRTKRLGRKHRIQLLALKRLSKSAKCQLKCCIKGLLDWLLAKARSNHLKQVAITNYKFRAYQLVLMRIFVLCEKSRQQSVRQTNSILHFRRFLAANVIRRWQQFLLKKIKMKKKLMLWNPLGVGRRSSVKKIENGI